MRNKTQVKIIKDFKVFRKFLIQQEHQLYVQTPEYGEFHKSLGHNYFLLGLYQNSKLIGASLVLDIKARRGRFYFLPYGPILDHSHKSHLKTFIKGLKGYAKRNRVDFIRVSPFQKNTVTNLEKYSELGFIKSPMHMLAETTWILDLSPSPEQLLKNMKQNHRNLIRRQAKLEIQIKRSHDIKDIKLVHQLLVQTSHRHDFVPFSLSYLEKEFQAFKKHKSPAIYLGYYNQELVAAAITYSYGNMTAYKHGASNMKYKKIPVSYCIQWQAIQDAKARGSKHYNFWGVAPETASKNHPFYGITHFKKGFCGSQLDLIPAHDLKISWKYYINWTIETFRKIKRGFN